MNRWYWETESWKFLILSGHFCRRLCPLEGPTFSMLTSLFSVLTLLLLIKAPTAIRNCVWWRIYSITSCFKIFHGKHYLLLRLASIMWSHLDFWGIYQWVSYLQIINSDSPLLKTQRRIKALLWKCLIFFTILLGGHFLNWPNGGHIAPKYLFVL